MRSPRTATYFMPFGAHGDGSSGDFQSRTALGDGIGWTMWESHAMSCRRFRTWRSIKRACWQPRSAKIDAVVPAEAGGFWGKLCRSSEAAAAGYSRFH